MPVTHLEIGGFRSFGTTQTLRFASPNGAAGSGLTILVGPNNSGKSTIIDSLRILQADGMTHFNESERNATYGRGVAISLYEGDHLASRTEVDPRNTAVGGRTRNYKTIKTVYIVPSRRTLPAFFSRHSQSLVEAREYYSQRVEQPTRPDSTAEAFVNRVRSAMQNPGKKAAFQKILERIFDNPPKWYIDVSPENSMYLKVEIPGGGHHTTNGLGEGLISLLFIADALYDSEPGDLIVLDEPELSLHPQQQRAVQQLLSEYSRDRQICYATHSPYFISWSDIANGATISRVFKDASGHTSIRQPARQTLKDLCQFNGNLFNPHTLGINANETFFLSDRIVVTEGQEDVVYTRLLSAELGYEHNWSFFGWGAGGADNIQKVVLLLNELGYLRVVGIVDNDKPEVARALQENFPAYKFVTIPADDIRTKKARTIAYKEGIFDEKDHVRPEYLDASKALLELVDEYLRQ